MLGIVCAFWLAADPARCIIAQEIVLAGGFVRRGEDAVDHIDQACELGGDAGFFFEFSEGCMLGGFAKFDAPAGD